MEQKTLDLLVALLGRVHSELWMTQAMNAVILRELAGRSDTAFAALLQEANRMHAQSVLDGSEKLRRVILDAMDPERPDSDLADLLGGIFGSDRQGSSS